MALISVDVLFDELCNTIKKQGRVEEVSKLFSQISTDENRVKFASDLLSEFGHLPFRVRIRKDATESVYFRNEGNRAFQNKNDVQALFLYSKSIAAAPYPHSPHVSVIQCEENECSSFTNSEELALGFANRSAVLFSLGHCELCLRDIEQALKYAYPVKLRFKLYERKGKCLQMKGDMKEACKNFTKALKCLAEASSLSAVKKLSVQADLLALRDKSTSQTNRTDPHVPCFENQSTVPSKSCGQHNCISSAASCVDVKFSPERGRYVVANRGIKPGDVIVTEKPFSSVLVPNCYYTHCHNCFLRYQALIPCQHCNMVMYCSKTCREMSWGTSHRIECALLPLLLQLNIGNMGLLALRIVIVASNCGKDLVQLCQLINSLEEELNAHGETKGFDKDGLYRSDNYVTIYHLIANTDKRKVNDVFRRAVKAACILNCLEYNTEFFKLDGNTTSTETRQAVVGGLLLRHLQNLPCNAHEVLEHIITAKNKGVSESLEIGAAAYSVLSLINHSCDPNVGRHSHLGDTAVLRAIRPIRSGEEILDNYGYHYALQQRDDRNSHLHSQYYFTCQCEACVNDWPQYESISSSDAIYKCSKCGSPLSKMPRGANSISCRSCQHKTNITNLENQIKTSSKRFAENVELLLSGSSNHDLVPELTDHLELLDTFVQRPWKEYNDCQEALKQCFNMVGNFYSC